MLWLLNGHLSQKETELQGMQMWSTRDCAEREQMEVLTSESM